MYCDNNATTFIINNLSYNARTKHTGVDCHPICHRIIVGLICTLYAAFLNQLTDIFTKGLSVTSYDTFSHKLSLYNLYAPA